MENYINGIGYIIFMREEQQIQALRTRIEGGVVGQTRELLELMGRSDFSDEIKSTIDEILSKSNDDLLFKKGKEKALLTQLNGLLTLIDRVGYKKAA